MSKKLIVAMFATLGLSTQVMAAGPVYVELAAGQSKADMDAVAGTTQDDTDTNFGLSVGYTLSDMFSVEAGYNDLGEASMTATTTGNKASVEMKGYSLGMAMAYPVMDKFEIVGRLGVYFWDADGKLNGATVLTEDGQDAFFGLGAYYKLSDAIKAGATWTRYGGDVDVDTFNVNLRVSF